MAVEPHRVTIRADASLARGVGHVMRCLTLATELCDRGHHVALFSVELADGLRQRASDAGVVVHDVDPAATDASTLEQMNAGAAMLVVDGYHLSSFAEAAFGVGTPVMLIDDNGELPSKGASLVLNQNLHADEGIYRGATDAHLLLGPPFAMVRPDLATVDRTRVTERDVLVAIGGTDPLGLTFPLTNALLERPDIRVWLGRSVIDGGPQQLRDQIRPDRIAVDPGDLSQAFSHATVAIIGGGSMMWEVAALGIPSIALVVADNQYAAAMRASEYGFAVMEDARTGVDVETVATTAARLLSDHDRRSNMARRGQHLIDGAGAYRVADAIEQLF